MGFHICVWPQWNINQIESLYSDCYQKPSLQSNFSGTWLYHCRLCIMECLLPWWKIVLLLLMLFVHILQIWLLCEFFFSLSLEIPHYNWIQLPYRKFRKETKKQRHKVRIDCSRRWPGRDTNHAYSKIRSLFSNGLSPRKVCIRLGAYTSPLFPFPRNPWMGAGQICPGREKTKEGSIPKI